ncbi:MAG: beta-aspartyl-dipeptidase (metallo-type) [Planctomycetota bacterium]|jgi:beta-aspartyl-dipeptidase (metallo-type)
MLALLTSADVYAPEPLGLVNLLIGGERILWIGSDLPQFSPELNVQVHDCGGARVVPGLIDCHAHLTGGGGETGYASRVPPVELSRLTQAGITTVVGLLGTDDCVRTTGSLLAAARALQAEGLTAFCYTGGYHVPPTTLTGSVRGDIVHLDLVLGVGEVAISDHRSSQPTANELLRLASEAHVGGLMTGKAGILHLHLGDGERGLDQVRECLRSEIPDRVFHPTHVNRRRELFDEAVALAKVHGLTTDLTAFPADDTDMLSAEEAWTQWHEAGAPADRLTISSDAGGCLPSFASDGTPIGFEVGDAASLTATLTALLAAGHTPDRVLPAFTSNVAKLLRLPQKGRIFTGADADLVVLDSQHRVVDVMARGRWHKRNGQTTVRGTFEAAAAKPDTRS